MLKKRIIAILAGLVLLATVTGSGIVANEFGVSVTPTVYACSTAGSGGGGC